MPRNDDGEFELVLGNRQLLTVFFLVIVLLGVFFAMGFIMGRSGSTSTVAEMKKPDNAPTERPIVVDAGAGVRPSAAGTVLPPKLESKPEPPPEPVKVAEAKPEPKKEEPKKEEPKKPEPKKAEPPPPAPATGGAPAGTYLQVAAVKRAEAEIVSGLVAKKGYRAYLIPLRENSDTFRVLVGPTRDRDQQNKMLEDLRAEGFKPFPRKL